MSSTFMAVALLAEPVTLTAERVASALAELPARCNASLERVSEDGTKASIRLDDVQFAVTYFDVPMPAADFQQELDKPGSGDIRHAVAAHTGQLVVFCRLSEAEMGQAVVAAAAVQLLTVKLGALGHPIAGQWVASKRLESWHTFASDADAAAAVYQDDQPVNFPSRFWVSVQLTRDGDKIGGHTIGLMPFTGYDVFLTPADIPLEFAAERLVGTVQYLFEAGPVLQDGQTLGISPTEKFKITRDSDGTELWLEFMGAALGGNDV